MIIKYLPARLSVGLVIVCCGIGLVGCSCLGGTNEDRHWMRWTPSAGTTQSAEEGAKTCNTKMKNKFQNGQSFGDDEVSANNLEPSYCEWEPWRKCAKGEVYLPWIYFRQCMKKSGFVQKHVVEQECNMPSYFGHG